MPPLAERRGDVPLLAQWFLEEANARGGRQIVGFTELKPDGYYFLQFANPFAIGVDNEAWDGRAYPLNGFYLDGEEMYERFPVWHVDQPDGTRVKCDSPREFRHTLGTVVNTLASNGFVLLSLWEWMREDEPLEPGSWAHFTHIMPPWFSTFWQLKI